MQRQRDVTECSTSWLLCVTLVAVLQDFPGVGWAWFAFKFQETNKFAVVDKGKGIGGGAASCAELKPNGGMSWACRWVLPLAGGGPRERGEGLLHGAEEGRRGAVQPQGEGRSLLGGSLRGA